MPDMMDKVSKYALSSLVKVIVTNKLAAVITAISGFDTELRLLGHFPLW